MWIDHDDMPIIIKSCLITHNNATSNNATSAGGGLAIRNHPTHLINCSVVSNSSDDLAGAIFGYGYEINLRNCILWNNSQSQETHCYFAGGATISISHSDIEEGESGIELVSSTLIWGDGNISDDPRFTDPDNGDYSLSQISPCIDVGHTEMFDPDGTQADMGVFSAKLETYEFSDEEINWSSFPVLNPNNIDAYDFFEPLIQNGSLRRVLYGDKKLYKHQSGIWINDIGDLRTVDGYRVEMYEPDYIYVYGYKVQPDTLISLYAEGNKALEFYPMGYHNWIGYFLPYSQTPRDAFANVWDNLTFIKADSYTLLRKWNSDEWWGGVSGPVSVDYGKSYAVGVLENCNFAWNQSPFHIEKYNKPETGLFTYEDKMNYMPIFVDSTEAVTGIDEIGVFVDDECIGASKIEGFLVFIPAYIDEDSTGSKDYNELTFQIATYGKSGKRSIPSFVYNKTQDAFVQEPVILDKDSYAIVRLGTGEGTEFQEEFTLFQNYPNPFSPRFNRGSTTISFVSSPGVEKSEIKIYNIKGQLIKKYDVQNAKSGINKLVWNGRNDNGKKLGNGIYFYKLIAGDKSEIKKMLLLR